MNLRPFIFSLFFIIIFFSNIVTLHAQQKEEIKSVVINSWQKGDGTISEKSLKLKLVNDEFNLDFHGTNQKREFRLQLEKIYVPTVRKPNPQCVSVALKEMFADQTTDGTLLGSNLFLTGSMLETSAHIICPIEKTVKALDGGLQSINVERIFNIEKFTVSIKVLNYEYDTVENRLNNIEMRIDFKNLVK
jgi:hypothetical protein